MAIRKIATIGHPVLREKARPLSREELASRDVQRLIDSVGEDNVLFETDFPHPTCLYPSPLDTVEEKMLTLRPETRRKVLGENAAKLYRI